jgi:hypothetical protein
MTAYLIRSREEESSMVHLSGDVRQILNLLNCEIHTEIDLKNGDCLLIDKHGLLLVNNYSKFFEIDGFLPNPENGLIIGKDFTEPKNSLEYYRNIINYHNTYYLKEVFNHQ